MGIAPPAFSPTCVLLSLRELALATQAQNCTTILTFCSSAVRMSFSTSAFSRAARSAVEAGESVMRES